MEPYRRELLALLERERGAIFALAERVVAQSRLAGSLTSSDLEQLLHGFERLLVEALEQRGREVRSIFIETAVPAVVAQGQTPPELASAATAFGVMLSTHLVLQLPEDQRAAGLLWFADFFGDYVGDLVAAALEASA